MTLADNSSHTTPLALNPQVFAPLAARIEGPVTTPNDSDWNTARLAWNLSADQRPEAVVAPQTAADVRSIVLFARDHGLRVVAQSTGHLAAPLGDLSGAILVRTAAFDAIDVDVAARTMRVGAGILWGDATAALADHGLMALAGSAPDVGVVGYLLGGGVSWFARSHGLATTYVKSIEVITGEGQMLRATASDEPELFHALRGGGGNFGIVTAVTFTVFDVSDAYAGMLMFPLDRADEVLTTWQQWTQGLDERATTSLRLLRMPPLPELPDFLRGQSFVVIDGAISGDPDAAAQLLAPLRALGASVDTFDTMPVERLGEIHMDPPGPVPGVGDGVNLDELPRGAIDTLLRLVGPEASSPLLAVDIRHIGGQLAVPHGEAAVNRLHGQYLLYAVGITPTPEASAAVTAATNAVLEAVQPWRSSIDYLNFREASVPPEQFYPPETLEALRAVKRRHDPLNLVHSAHPIA